MRRHRLLIVPLVVSLGLSGAALAATHASARASCKVTPKGAWTVCPRGNLAGRDLGHADLRNANLAGANLTGATLTQANLATANLARANITRALLDNANLSFANLVGARLDRRESLTRDAERCEPRPRESLGSQPAPRQSRRREPGRREPRERKPRAGEPGGREPPGCQPHGCEPQPGVAGRDELQPCEPDPSGARELHVERRVPDRRESLRRKPAWRDGDGRRSLVVESRRREARRMSAGTASICPNRRRATTHC